MAVFTAPRRVLAASLYSAVATGAFYGFGLYSNALKKQFSLTQQQLVNINTIPYLFGLISSIWGEMNRCIGPAKTVLLGGIMMASSQSLTYLMGMRLYEPPSELLSLPIAFVCSSIITFIGMQIVSSACFTAPVQHYPKNRGSVAALVKSFVGLGGAAVTESYVVLFGTPTPDPTAFNALLLWAGFVLMATVTASMLMPRQVDPEAVEPEGVLAGLFPTITLLGVFATVTSLYKKVKVLHDTLTYGMLLFALVPAVVIFGSCCGGDETKMAALPAAAAASTSPSLSVQVLSAVSRLSDKLDRLESKVDRLLSGKAPPASSSSSSIASPRTAAAKSPAKPAAISPTKPATAPSSASPATPAVPPPLARMPTFEGRTQTIGETVRTLECWLFLFTGVVVVGSGTVIATNISQIIESAGGDSDLLTTCVTLFSTGNLLGRLLCMIPSDAFVRRGLPRPLFVALIAATAAAAHGSFYAAAALTAPGSPLQAIALVGGAGASGLSFGAQWPHFMVVTSELFGSKYLPTNYMFIDGMSGAAGTMLLANVLPSKIYEAAAIDNDCSGPACFGPTHLIIDGLLVAATGSALLLACRSAPLYREIAIAMADASGTKRELV